MKYPVCFKPFTSSWNFRKCCGWNLHREIL